MDELEPRRVARLEAEIKQLRDILREFMMFYFVARNGQFSPEAIREHERDLYARALTLAGDDSLADISEPDGDDELPDDFDEDNDESPNTRRGA